MEEKYFISGWFNYVGLDWTRKGWEENGEKYKTIAFPNIRLAEQAAKNLESMPFYATTKVKGEERINVLYSEEQIVINKCSEFIKEFEFVDADFKDLLNCGVAKYDSEVDSFVVDDEDCMKYYNEDGHYSCECMPAIINKNGDAYWYIDGQLHRDDDQPAIECMSGEKRYYYHGKLHRESGPAIEYADGTKNWFIDDVQIGEEEFNERNMVILSKKDISNKFNIPVERLKIVD